MRSVICIWNNTNDALFEQSIPLQFCGQLYNDRAYKIDLDLIVLDGYEQFSDSYKERLKEFGYILIDCSGAYHRLSRKYSALDRFGDYEKKCFLRWLVLYEYYAGEQIIHLDGDIVLNESLDTIQKKLINTTFVMQGCPACTSISDKHWYTLYTQELNVLCNNIEQYSQQAWSERDGWEESKNKWAGSRFRKIITSDQDFLSHLIHTDRIIQDSPDSILKKLNGYILFESPLYLNAYHPWCNEFPFRYSRRDVIDFINDYRVLFWHMHSDFVRYLSQYIIMNNCSFLKCHKVQYKLENIMDIRNICGKLLNRKWGHPRSVVYDYFFLKNDFSGLFNDETWWKDGVF